MDIILDEKKFAENSIKNNILGNKPSATLNILARYYREEGYSDNEIFDSLEKFMRGCLGSEYNSAKWLDCIDIQVNKSHKFKLIQIDEINITATELQTIERTLNNPRTKRLAFTLLVLAKYHNMVYEKNNNWVNEKYKTIFTLSSINVIKKEQSLMMHELVKAKLVSVTKHIGKINLCVNFIDDTSSTIMSITDMRELGKQYDKFYGKKYINCDKCGILFKPNKHNHKYCSRCAKYQPIETKVIKCCDCGKEMTVDSKDNMTIRCEECQKLAHYTPIETKVIVCQDCGKEFEVEGINKRTTRCPECYKIYRKIKNREKALKYYNSKK